MLQKMATKLPFFIAYIYTHTSLRAHFYKYSAAAKLCMRVELEQQQQQN